MPVISRASLVALAIVPFLACGGGPTDPTPTGPPPNTDVHTVTVTVFEDENRNGRIDAGETLWVPDVEVEIGGRTAKSEKRSGRTVVTGVPRGTHAVAIRPNSLPPYYQAGAPVTVESPPPANTDVKVPVILPIGTRMIAGVYFASGDSISQGESSSDGLGFRPLLREQLLDHFGRAEMFYRGGGGGRTADGAQRMDRDLDGIRPAYTMLNWGVNDWNEPGCGNPSAATCPIVTNLKSMVQQVRAFGSLPCLVTLIPANVGFDDKAPPERNVWVRQVNDLIRNLARQERVLVIDAGDVFFKQPSLAPLYVDHVHPSDAGYRILADVYFQALTHGTVSSAAGGVAPLGDLPSFGFSAPDASAHGSKALR